MRSGQGVGYAWSRAALALRLAAIRNPTPIKASAAARTIHTVTFVPVKATPPGGRTTTLGRTSSDGDGVTVSVGATDGVSDGVSVGATEGDTVSDGEVVGEGDVVGATDGGGISDPPAIAGATRSISKDAVAMSANAILFIKSFPTTWHTPICSAF
jgi:hypothetical protein